MVILSNFFNYILCDLKLMYILSIFIFYIRQSPSGFISEELLLEWVMGEFVDYCDFQRRKQKNQPIIIFCDGHSSRFSPQLWKSLLQRNIHLLCIPSHTSHLLQLLDLYPNSVIKKNLQSVSNLKPKPTEEEIIQFIHKIECCLSQGVTKDCIFEGLLIYLCFFFFFN
jgi:hypothetical protein